MNGIIVLDKPPEKSSHDMVYAIRRLSGEKRVGHAGTLDPLATGVLVICVGNAVRLSEYLIEHDKTYRARVRLGVETDTFDATGKITSTQSVNVSRRQVEDALASFVGNISQVPPSHSAVQRDGVRAYKLARQGVAVEMKPRSVEIYSIRPLEFDGTEAEFEVQCSKGTYIRSLAHDLGTNLGTGAHLTGLRRLASGDFTIEQSVTIDTLTEAAGKGEIAKYLLPMDRAVSQFDAVTLDLEGARRVVSGQYVSAPPNLTSDLVRAYDKNGELIALLEKTKTGELKPKKVFESH